MFLEWDIDRVKDHLLEMIDQSSKCLDLYKIREHLDKTQDCLKFLLIQLDKADEKLEEQEITSDQLLDKLAENEQYIADLETEIIKLKDTIEEKTKK